MEQEKIFVNDVTDKESISKLYKQFIQLSIKKETTESKKWTEEVHTVAQ